MSPSRRRKMVDREHPKLPIVRQCALLGVSRSSLYYRPKGASEADLSLMREMDRQYLETPFYGSRRMKAWLDRQGIPVSRKRVQRLMRVMGLRAIYRRPRASQPTPEHRVYPYLLRNARVTRPNQVWAGDTTYAYDANGNMTQRGDQTLMWDVENRLTEVSDSTGTIATFIYDADGNRVAKIEGGVTTHYVNCYYEKDITTPEETITYYHGDRRVAVKKGTELSYIHTDHLGSTAVTTDSTGAEVSMETYLPFGDTREQTGTLQTDRRYTGQRLDDTGPYFYNARYYDAALGRFISADSIVPELDNSQSWNRYSYVRNNPLKYTDPTGHSGAAVGAAGSAAAGACIVVSGGTCAIIVGGVVVTGVLIQNPDLITDAWDSFWQGARGIGSAISGFFRSVFFGDDPGLNFNDHAKDTMAKRGWTEEEVRELVRKDSGTRTKVIEGLEDSRWNPATGTQNNIPAQGYMDANGNYVVINENGDVVEVSDKNNPGWKKPWDKPDFKGNIVEE